MFHGFLKTTKQKIDLLQKIKNKKQLISNFKLFFVKRVPQPLLIDVSKRLSDCFILACLATSLGSMPCAGCFLISVFLVRACANDKAGYLPNVFSFCLPL